MAQDKESETSLYIASLFSYILAMCSIGLSILLTVRWLAVPHATPPQVLLVSGLLLVLAVFFYLAARAYARRLSALLAAPYSLFRPTN